MVRPTFGDRVHHELAIHTSRLVDTEAEVNISPKNHFFFLFIGPTYPLWTGGQFTVLHTIDWSLLSALDRRAV